MVSKFYSGIDAIIFKGILVVIAGEVLLQLAMSTEDNDLFNINFVQEYSSFYYQLKSQLDIIRSLLEVRALRIGKFWTRNLC